MVALAQREIDGVVFHGAAIEEDELLRAGGAAHAGFAEEPADGDGVGRKLGHVEQLRGEGGPAQIAHAVAQMRGGRELPDDAVVIDKDEAGLRMADGLEVKLVLDVAGLGVFGAQKFPARGEIVEKRAHLDLRARCFAAVAHGLDFPAADEHLGAGEGVALAGGEAEARDAGDARQRFAAEAEGVDRGEVGARANLARGVALEAEQGVVAVHAGAVVDHADVGDAAAADHYLDPRGSGVAGVYDQLFDHARGPLHDLAGSHLAGDGFGE